MASAAWPESKPFLWNGRGNVRNTNDTLPACLMANALAQPSHADLVSGHWKSPKISMDFDAPALPSSKPTYSLLGGMDVADAKESAIAQKSNTDFIVEILYEGVCNVVQ